ncbi:MAG: elongation factor G [Candidatus Brocadiia bacterium]
MAKRAVENIRNIAVVGHGSSGKTTFVDHALHAAGAVERAGSVDEGNSLSDYTEEEREHKFSIQTTAFKFDYDNVTFNLIDTPGYLDFTGSALVSLPAAETALIAVDAAEGVRLNTRRMWEYAEDQEMSRILLLTHLDADNIQFENLLDNIRDSLGRQCVPVFLPVGTGEACSDVVNVLTAQEAPDGVIGDFDALHDELRESIIECDDELMEAYLEGEEVGQEQLEDTFKQAILDGTIIPILCCVAQKEIGLEETLDFLAACSPSPVEGPTRTADVGETEVIENEDGEEEVVEPDTAQITPDPDSPFCAKVFKSVTDPHVGKRVYFRIYSGTLEPGDNIQVARTGTNESPSQIYSVFGEKQQELERAIPGDLVCVTKVEDMKLGDTIRDPEEDWILPDIELPTPMMSLAIEPVSRDDEQKIQTALRRLCEEDPTFDMYRDEQSGEQVITGMSNLHLDVILSELEDNYGVACETHSPSIPYRETITAKAEGQYRHKKQSGGRGQYGEVYLRIAPNERGEGFEFIDAIKGGVIPQQYIPAVEKGIKETMDEGLLAGHPIVDLKVEVYYGSYHDVDSSEAAFKIAGSRAFRNAFEDAKPTLLEPIVEVDVTVPSEYVGDVTANLSGHRGQIQGMDQEGQMQTLTAMIPQAEIRRYAAELQSMTGGEGTFTMDFSHYEPVPSHLQEQIIEQSGE